MSHMANGAFGNIRALVARDLLDAVRNPTTLMSCGAGALFTAFIGGVVATSSRLTPGEADAFAQVAVFCIAPAFAGCVIELYVMAEERERGAYVTLVEAGVTAGEIAVSKWLSAVLVTLVTQIVSCLLLGLAPARAALLLGLSAVGVQPLLFAGLVAGLSAREQMSSSLLAVPLTVVALAPILAFMSGTVRAITWFWPLGPVACRACRRVDGGHVRACGAELRSLRPRPCRRAQPARVAGFPSQVIAGHLTNLWVGTNPSSTIPLPMRWR